MGLKVFWAKTAAVAFCLRCPLLYRVWLESRWVEVPGQRNAAGDTLYREETTFVGVVALNEELNGDLRWRIVRTYFGESRVLE